jgi:flagellar basal-body rod protein FlgC
MRISGSALTAQRLRMDVISSNIANADTTRVNGQQRTPYQREEVVFQPLQPAAGSPGDGLQVSAIVKDPAPPKQVYDPTHPDADPNTGLVAYPNVDTTTEMTDMLSANRAYEANVTVLSSIKEMAQRSIDLGKA